MSKIRTAHQVLRTTDSSYEKTILDNGVRVVTESIPYVRSVSLGIWANVGSRDETSEHNGLSHFLEHMVFKGTRRRTVRDIAQSLESLGGYLNAFTTKEQTCFYARVLGAHVGEAMDVLSDLVLNATFRKEEVEKEKQVVIEELHNAEDDPEDIIHDYFEKALFPRHSLGFPIIGTEKNLRAFDRSHLREHASFFYRPESLVVAAAGKVDHKAVVRLAEKYLGRLESPSRPYQRSSGARESVMPGLEEYERRIQQSHLCMGTIGYSLTHRDRYPLHVLNGLLGEGMSSRLYQSIRERHGLAYSVYSFSTTLSDTGVWGVYIGTDPKNLKRSAELVRKELRTLQRKKVGTDELRRTKSQIKGNLMLGLESMSNRMMRLGGGELHYGRYIPLDNIIRHVDGVNSSALLRVANDLLNVDRFVSVSVRPANGE